MKALLKSIMTTQGQPVEDFAPVHLDNFVLYLTLELAPMGTEGADLYDLTVCTPKWLAEELESKRIIMGRHLLIVKKYEPQIFLSAIYRFVESSKGSTWDDLSEKLQRLAHSEFEDYDRTGPSIYGPRR